jgi:DNA-binding NtrC family response regulator
MEWKYLFPILTSIFKAIGEWFPRSKRHCIMIVDDNPLDSKLLQLHLRNSNFQIDTASSAEEAEGMMRVKNYSIAFLDIRLPSRQGWQLAQEILDEFPKTHIVIVCGETDDLAHFPVGAYVGLIKKPPTAHAVNSLLEKTRVN